MAIALAFWLWLRIVLSAVMRRMVLESPLTSLRRMARWRALSPALAAAEPGAPLPRPMLRVGVIGHRVLGEQETHVDVALAKALDACRRPGYGLRIVSGMATGTPEFDT